MGAYPGLSSWAQCSHKGRYKWKTEAKRKVRGRCDYRKAQTNARLLVLKMEERGHESRNVDVLGFSRETENIYTCTEDIKRQDNKEKIYMYIYYSER